MGLWFRLKSSFSSVLGRIFFIVVAIVIVLFIVALIRNGGDIMAVLDGLMGG